MSSDLSIDIIYHNDGILIVNKPFGLASQPTRNNDDNLYDILQEQFPYVALHHRLDQSASGLILLSTKKHWNKALSSAFQQRTIARGYLIWVVGQPPDKGEWNYPIDGKKARSSFQTLYTDGSQSILLVFIHSGRTHQIRRHAMKAGFPIFGDRRYGGIAGQLWERLALHATFLQFTHPATQKRESIVAPIPANLEDIFLDVSSEKLMNLLHLSSI